MMNKIKAIKMKRVRKPEISSKDKVKLDTPLSLWALNVRFQYAESKMRTTLKERRKSIKKTQSKIRGVMREKMNHSAELFRGKEDEKEFESFNYKQQKNFNVDNFVFGNEESRNKITSDTSNRARVKMSDDFLMKLRMTNNRSRIEKNRIKKVLTAGTPYKNTLYSEKSHGRNSSLKRAGTKQSTYETLSSKRESPRNSIPKNTQIPTEDSSESPSKPTKNPSTSKILQKFPKRKSKESKISIYKDTKEDIQMKELTESTLKNQKKHLQSEYTKKVKSKQGNYLNDASAEKESIINENVYGIKEGQIFKQISEIEMISHPLSEETIKLEDVAVSLKYKTSVNTMLKKIAKMTVNKGLSEYPDPSRKPSNLQNKKKKSTRNHSHGTDHNNKSVDNSHIHGHIKPLEEQGLPLLTVANQNEDNNNETLNISEKEFLKELIKEKLQQFRERCLKLFPNYDNKDTYNKNFQARNEIMRKFKFEQLKKTSMNNFIRDAKKFILSKRKQKEQSSLSKADSMLFSELDRLSKESSKDIQLQDPIIDDMQKEFVDWVLANLKRDGKRARTKDLRIKKCYMGLLSYDMNKMKVKKNSKANVKAQYDNIIDAMIQKHNKDKALKDKTISNIKRRVVPNISYSKNRKEIF
ncbi:unnamed protein product [Moneuplotes crassus]|uniref:Uncharacterized protein n=1 Tax=Euplotes crassus TaxID=5936 RepID=A0AAD1Y408_EUPCR|nr:unnamed protein product [Moneuplotes crassus]